MVLFYELLAGYPFFATDNNKNNLSNLNNKTMLPWKYTPLRDTPPLSAHPSEDHPPLQYTIVVCIYTNQMVVQPSPSFNQVHPFL